MCDFCLSRDYRAKYRVIKNLCAPDDYSTNSLYSNNPHKIDELKMVITEYIRNVDRAILNTVFGNTFRPVDKCLESGGETSDITCIFMYCNNQMHRDFLITLYINVRRREMLWGLITVKHWYNVTTFNAQKLYEQKLYLSRYFDLPLQSAVNKEWIY